MNEALLRGHKVTVLASPSEKITVKNERLTVVQGEATDPAMLARVAKSINVVITPIIPLKQSPSV